MSKKRTDLDWPIRTDLDWPITVICLIAVGFYEVFVLLKLYTWHAESVLTYTTEPDPLALFIFVVCLSGITTSGVTDKKSTSPKADKIIGSIIMWSAVLFAGWVYT